VRGLDAWDTAHAALGKTFAALTAEHATYDRLVYKNSSQHKRSLHWRHIKEAGPGPVAGCRPAPPDARGCVGAATPPCGDGGVCAAHRAVFSPIGLRALLRRSTTVTTCCK
jgi:hypothetical protein